MNMLLNSSLEQANVGGQMPRGVPGAISRNLGSTPCTHQRMCEQHKDGDQ